MKLNQIFESMLLTEAARFGNKEMKEVKKYSKDFTIGVEYEFHVDNEHVEATVTDYDSLEARDPVAARELLAAIKNDLLTDHFRYNAEDVIADMQESYDEIDGLQAGVSGLLQQYLEDVTPLANNGQEELFSDDTMRMSLSNLEGLVDEFGQFSNAISQFIPALREAESRNDLQPFHDAFTFLQNNNRTFKAGGKLFNDTIQLNQKLIELDERDYDDDPEYIRSIHSLIQKYNENYFMRPSAIDDFPTYQFDIENELIEIAESEGIVDDMAIEQASEAIANQEPWVYEITGFRDDSEGAVEFVEDNWSHPDTEVIHEEHMENGVEVVSRPLTLDSQFNYMSNIFDFIRNNGYTTNETGMHVNLSHKSFKQEGKFNPVKMLALLDPEYMQRVEFTSTNAHLHKWEVRSSMVAEILKLLDQQTIYGLAKEYEENRSFDNLESQIRKLLVRENKFRSVNFTYYMLGSDNPQKRIEYRFFGGDDYINRYDEIIRDIYFVCYTMLAASEPKFLRKEYIKNLFRMLDKQAKAHWQMSFLDLVNVDDEDLV